MLSDFVNQAGEYIQTNPWLGVFAVFVGGVLTASSPCVLAMIPLMMSYVAGQTGESRGVLRAFGLSLVFVLGLSISFTILGMLAALFGHLYGDISSIWNWVVAVVCVVMGAHLAGLFTVPIPTIVRFQPKATGIVGALVLGLLFGFVSAPCAAPILVVLLTYLAGSNSSVAYGGLLLLTYGLGHSVLILVAGTSMGAAQKLIESKGFSRASDVLRRVSGVVIVLVGLYFAYLGLR
jgi:cytochrome c-type biogenesis protein